MGELCTRTVLRENDLYLVGDAHYAVAAGESGLYRRDIRFLCPSELFAGFLREAQTPPVPYPAACHPQGWDAAAVLALGAGPGCWPWHTCWVRAWLKARAYATKVC